MQIITAYKIQLSACLKSFKGSRCITDFGVSTVIITFFIVGASSTLDSSMEGINCNTKLTKKFISVGV